MKDYPPYFKASELTCKCGKCHGGEMDDEFMAKVIMIREECNFPFFVNSAYRCPAYNEAQGGAQNSEHTRGRALDIAVSNPQAFIIVREAIQHLARIGVSQKSGNARFVHLGGDSEPSAIWNY